MDTPELTLFRKAVEIAKDDFFRPEYRNPENEDDRKITGLGKLIAQYAHWDGIEILKIAAMALEDANFHGECAKLLKMAKKYESVQS